MLQIAPVGTAPNVLEFFPFDLQVGAEPRSAISSMSDSRARRPGFDTRSVHISFSKGSFQLLAKVLHEALVNRLKV